MIEIYRYNPNSERWKRLQIRKDEEGRFFVSMTTGKKGSDVRPRSVTIMLSEAEVALISVKLQKMIDVEESEGE